MTWTYNPNHQCRAWCWTLNNYTPAHLELIAKWRYSYIVYGQEVGESGTPHLQGFLYAASAVKASTLKNKIKELHLEPARGTHAQAAEYCKKGEQSHQEWSTEGTAGPNYGLRAAVTERGTCPEQGARTDLTAIRQAVTEGKGMRHMLELTDSYQGIRMGELLLKHKEGVRRWTPEVTWVYGPSGAGKTHYAEHCCGADAYFAEDNSKWWEGYDAHEEVVVPEFRWDWVAFPRLLQLLDRYPCRVECKGGSRQFLARRIFICTTYDPAATFRGRTEEDLVQLTRRITNIVEMRDWKVYAVHKGAAPAAREV